MKKYKAWTDEEIAIVGQMRNTHTLKEIGKFLGRSEESIAGKSALFPKHVRTWTAEELATIEEMYQSHTARVIAEKISRSTSAVQNQITRIKLRKMPEFETVPEVESFGLPHYDFNGAFADVFMMPAPTRGARVCSPLGGW